MAILSDINSALNRIGSALFQQLGDELLTAIYKPINIESRGTKEGQNHLYRWGFSSWQRNLVIVCLLMTTP